MHARILEYNTSAKVCSWGTSNMWFWSTSCCALCDALHHAHLSENQQIRTSIEKSTYTCCKFLWASLSKHHYSLWDSTNTWVHIQHTDYYKCSNKSLIEAHYHMRFVLQYVREVRECVSASLVDGKPIVASTVTMWVRFSRLWLSSVSVLL